MLISHSHRFIFFHVAKTAGLSVREALMPYTEEPTQFKIKRPPRLKDGQPNPFYTVWEALLLHAKASDAQKELPPEIFERYYKFAFVRNPWDWQVSMYHFILSDPTNARHQLVKSFGNFERYLEWVIATPHPFAKGATKLQKEALADRDDKLLVDFIGRYETLAQDFNHVCRTLNITTELPHVNKSAHRDYRDYYDERTRQLVADHFAADIALFGYTFEGIRN
ncbi:MAG: sulfotransferase family 2 domain-containing protein [Chloroflexota bacterium]|nr:sulfotransferase family 2 domain-containing protein [Chloroflexota bacterium]